MAIVVVQDPNHRVNFYKLSEIYNPDSLPQDPNAEMVVPEVGSLIIDPAGSLYWVTAVDPTTLKSTLAPATSVITDENAANQVSVADYGNNVFRVFVDPRNSPTRLAVQARMVVYGNAATYQLIKNYGETDSEVVSRHYDANGNYLTTQVPMAAMLTDAGDPSGMSYPTECHTLTDLPDNTKLTMAVYNSHGALVALVSCFTLTSAILNESPGYVPMITGIRLAGTQVRENDEFFLYENQDPDSLNIQAYLVYDDGNEVLAEFDNLKCFMYGLEDFQASWTGLRQNFMVKYFLSNGELVQPGLTEVSSITATGTIVVIPNDAGAGVRISVMPQWSVPLSKYVLHYFKYTTDRDSVVDITANTTISTGAFVGDLYGVYQTFTIAVDLSVVDPTHYNQSTIHYQAVTLRLQPIAAYERYIVRDTPTSVLVYGVDQPTSRRPVIHYDTTLEQYFIPSSIFLTEAGFIDSFYTKSGPTFDPVTEQEPPAPTHFTIRDLSNSAMVISTPIAIASYATAWSVTGTPADRFVGTNLVVEFLHEVSAGVYLLLMGAPADCYVSESGYLV